MSYVIRPASKADAERLLRHRQALMEETPFMLFEPGELDKTPADEAQRILRLNSRTNSRVFIATNHEIVVGNLTAVGGEVRRLRHSATLALGVLKEHWGGGVGGSLLEHVIAWSEQVQLHRLELTVHTVNHRALKLYLRYGFEVEGVRRHSLLVDGQYVNEYLMSRLSGA